MLLEEYISQHFKRSEFACKCGCGFDAVDAELAYVLEYVRFYLQNPIIITSGNRCVKHNNAVGGSPKSQHLKGKAADFKVIGIHADKVADFMLTKFKGRYGIGRYDGRCHLDVRSKASRWDLRK